MEGAKKEKNKRNVRSVRLTPTVYSLVWVLLVVLAVIFGQALRNPVSYSFGVTVMLIPPLELIYLLLTAPFIRAEFETEGRTVVKFSPFGLKVRARNRSILPAPFVSLRYTADEGQSVSANLPLTPFGKGTAEAEIRFNTRGPRPCRLDSVSVDSLLRMFRVTFRSDGAGTVLVLPRVLNVSFPEPRDVMRLDVAGLNLTDNDSDEVDEITEYQPGDKLKNVHWKLSGKADTLLVKKYGSRGSSESLIVPDLRVMGREKAEYDKISDVVIEAAVAAALNRSERDRTVVLRLPESPDGDFADLRPDGRDGLDACLPSAAAAPAVTAADPYLMFGKRPEGETVFVTPNCDPETISVINELAVACPPVTVVFCSPDGSGGDAWNSAQESDVAFISGEALS